MQATFPRVNVQRLYQYKSYRNNQQDATV